MPTPLFLVTEYRNTRRKHNEFTNEWVEVFKVVLMHGFYAGMGMNLFFPTEPDAARFSMHTVYMPDEVSKKMAGENFVVQDIKKTGFMAPANKYTDLKVLMENWRVLFLGDRGTILETFHPWEIWARVFKLGSAYTMEDLLNTIPSVDRDNRALLEAYAEKLALEEERRRRSAYYDTQADRMRTFQEQNAIWQAGQEERLAEYLEQFNQIGAGLSERDQWIEQFMTGGFSQAQAEAAWEIHYSFLNPPPPEDPPDPPVDPPPPPPPDPPPLTVDQQKNMDVAEWFVVTNNGAAGWYAGARSDVGSRTWEQAWFAAMATGYRLFATGDFTLQAALDLQRVFGGGIRNVSANGQDFEFFGFYVRT